MITNAFDRSIQRASTDAMFRQKLINNPTATLREAGEQVPEDSNVRVVDGRENEMHVILGGDNAPQALQKVIDQAGKDTAFKNRLLANPKAVLAAAMDEDIPSDISIFVHDQQPGECLLLLPPIAKPSNAELSEAQLAGVVGGGGLTLRQRIGNALCGDTQTVLIDDVRNQYTIYTDHSVTNSSDSGSLIVW